MTELRLPVLKFASEADCQRAADVLRDQQFEFTVESNIEIACQPWSDLDDAQALLDAEGIDCARAEKIVARKGPGALPPRR